jgi:hypothetical protein
MQDGLIFGIYPGGDSGVAVGPPDDPRQVRRALDALQPAGRPFVVRGYLPFKDASDDPTPARETPLEVAQYATDLRRVDLVLQFQSRSGDVAGYLEFVRTQVLRLGGLATCVQITEEPNNAMHGLDGGTPNVLDALVEGVLVAKAAAQAAGYTTLQVGFNAVPSVGDDAAFWSALGGLGGRRFVDALDYVGFDFFPDVFRPLDDARLSPAIEGLLGALRERWLPAAGIPASVPLHIAETGWPTGAGRSAARQAVVLEAVLRTVHGLRERYGISQYELFSLRDADSVCPDVWYQFGLLRSDYTPKPAFATMRRLIAELSGA